MAYVTRDGVRLYYEDHGSGPAVLLSHGYGATSQMWQDQVAVFKDRYRIIVWDLRGHGESDYPDDLDLYSKQHTVADIGALLDACGLERAIIGGHSLGGYSTLAFHRVHPERCDALMLFNCGPGFKKDDARLKWNETAERRAKRFEGEGLTIMGDRAEFLRAEHHHRRLGFTREEIAQWLEKAGLEPAETIALEPDDPETLLTVLIWTATKPEAGAEPGSQDRSRTTEPAQ